MFKMNGTLSGVTVSAAGAARKGKGVRRSSQRETLPITQAERDKHVLLRACKAVTTPGEQELPRSSSAATLGKRLRECVEKLAPETKPVDRFDFSAHFGKEHEINDR